MSEDDIEKVILFDIETDGHHVQHVKLLSRFLLAEGIKVRFVTHECNQSAVEDILPTSEDKFDIEYIRPTSVVSHLGSGRVSKMVTYGSCAAQCLSRAEDWGADVVHFMSVDRVELAFGVALALNGSESSPHVVANLIIPYYDVSYNRPARSIFHWLKSTQLRWLIESRRLDKLFVLSDENRRLLIESWGREAADYIITIPDPIEPVFEDVPPERPPTADAVESKRQVVLFFGKLRYTKGPDVLLESVPSLSEDVGVVFAGSGDHVTQKDIEEAKVQFDDPDRIVDHLAFVSEGEMRWYYEAADVVALPYREAYTGTSGILQHAIASKTPVVATGGGQIGQIVETNGFGAVVPPGSPDALADGIKHVLSNGMEDGFGSRADQYVEDNHYLEWAKKIRNVYMSL